MAKYRDNPPMLRDEFFLTDGGIETTLIFNEGLDLPYFAAFDLLKTSSGAEALRNYFRTYAALAVKHRAGLVLETATWRANADWAEKLAYNADALDEANRQCVRLLEEIRAEYETPETPIVISGCVGPRGDGYVPTSVMSAQQAEEYHAMQIRTFASTNADLVTAITMNYPAEAMGIARAAKTAGVPVVISFTVETDGKLPTGHSLADAIAQVDETTSDYPAYYMINCAHPTHFSNVMNGSEPWTHRIRGLRANASTMSHAELNDSPTLDSGNPEQLSDEYAALKKQQLQSLTVFGGCCGTDHRHVEQMAIACAPFFRGAA